MFGKLMSIPDEAMDDYWLLLLGEELDRDRHPGEAKRELARRLVDRFGGDGAGGAAEERFDQVHVRGELPDEIPTVTVDADGGEVHLPRLLASEFGLSSSEARRLIQQGGVRIDGDVVEPGRLDLPASVLAGKVVQVGKRRFVRVAP
jgi:tyrosyl-tRNA synthetase